MKKSIRTILSLAAIGCTLAPAATAGNTVQAAIESIDRIVGVRQENAPPLGYATNPDYHDDLTGATGWAGGFTRYCRNTVIRFSLPTLPSGMAVLGATLNYQIRQSRTQSGADFDAHVYLLDTADPGDSGVSFYYNGPGDPSTDVAFVGSTYIPHVGTDNVDYDPPLSGSHVLGGSALQLLQSFYNGRTPAQTEAFFRLNRSTPTAEIGGAALDRYYIEIGPGDVTLQITYGLPPLPERDMPPATPQSKDSIIGQAQQAAALGYYPDANNGMIGTSGAGGNKTDRVAVVGFALPTLPERAVASGATLRFKVTRVRNFMRQNFDGDVYLLDTASPDGTSTAFYHAGPSDTSSDVAFVGRTVFGISGTDEVTLDPPLEVFHQLSGNAQTLLASFYDGHHPMQPEAFFRFNRTNDPFPDGYDRYTISLADEDLSLVIHYIPPRLGTIITFR